MIIPGNIDVRGPASATDNALMRWNGATGKLAQNGIVTEADDTGTLTGPIYSATTTAVGTAFTNQPANDGVEVVSADNGDTTQTVTIIGTTTGVDTVVVETVTLNGTTAVATVKTDWGVILAVKKSAATVGTVTVREASLDATITAGLTAAVLSVGVTTVAAADQPAYARTVSVVSDGATTKQIGFKGTNTSDAVIYDSQALNGATAVLSNSSFRTITEIYVGDVEAARTETVTTTGTWVIGPYTINTSTGDISGFATGAGLTLHGGGTITGASGAITITASGTNQNITLTPSGSGYTLLNGNVGIANVLPTSPLTVGAISTASSTNTSASFGTVSAHTVRIGYQATTLARSELRSTNADETAFTALAIDASTLVLQGRSGGRGLGGGLLTDDAVTILQVKKAAVATTHASAVTIINDTLATAVVPVQMSGQLSLQGTAWDTAASQTLRWFIENLPASAATPTSTLKIGHSLNGAAATYPMTLTNAGLLTATGSIFCGGGLVAGASGEIKWSGRAAFISPSGFIVKLTDNTGVAGVTFDASTDATLKVRNFANSADAAITYSLNATTAAAPTIASATTIAPTTRFVFVSGVTTIETITAPAPISTGGGSIVLIPTGVFSTGVTGNIALASTSVVSKALVMTYDTTTTKWYPSY